MKRASNQNKTEEKKETKSSLPLFDKTQLTLHLLGIQYQYYAALINFYPYILPANAYAHFQNTQQKYQRQVQRFKYSDAEQLIETSRIFQDSSELYQHLYSFLDNSLRLIHQTIKDDYLAISVKMLHNTLNQYHDLLTASTEDIKEMGSSLKSQLEKQLLVFSQAIAKIQQASLKKYTLAKCRQATWTQKMRLLQQSIAVLQLALQNIKNNCLIQYGFIENVNIEDYADLIFLATIFTVNNQSAIIVQSLEYKLALQWELYTQTQKYISALKTKLGQNGYHSAIRLLRFNAAYEQWMQILKKTIPSLSSVTSIEQAIKIQRLLTYEKKEFLKKCLTKQGHILIFQLQRLSEQYPDSVVQHLQNEKNKLIINISSLEKQLIAGQSLWQKLKATAWLSISQQPDYQLGQSAFPVVLEVQSGLEDIKEEEINRCAHFTGFIFVSIALISSYYTEYYAHIINAINRVCISQINFIFRVGGFLDQQIGLRLCSLKFVAASQSRIVLNLVKAIRTDEIGLLEKDEAIRWLNGLFINFVLMPTQPILSIMAGYTLASTASNAVVFWIEELAKITKMELLSGRFLKIGTHFIIYPKAYRAGFAWYIPVVSEKMSLATALQTLGLEQIPKTKQELNKEYRRLSLLFHPDHCKEKICTEKMVELNLAKEVLMSNFQN